STGVERTKAILALESSKKIGEPDYTPAPNVCYEAGKSIVLKPGFVVEKYSVFSAEIRGCE
ncbi:3-coathanger stack domain-containing protein, partial [Massilia pinisoli]|uniref:3-coathanger stack domain-containing protein n=1 Tax=Massilia pinisoli TaxID=1772194 RepID=UPI003625D114